MNERFCIRLRSVDYAVKLPNYKHGFGVLRRNVNNFVIFGITPEEPAKKLLRFDNAH
jgi:hypothetical protein